MAKQWAIGAGILFAFTTIARTVSVGKAWRRFIPGGIAVAIGQITPFSYSCSGANALLAGMYNVPSFTLARAIGGVGAWYWVSIMKRSNTPLIILASVSHAAAYIMA